MKAVAALRNQFGGHAVRKPEPGARDRRAPEPRPTSATTRRPKSASPGPNLFVGRNGQGKTNLVESIGYLTTLGSHRVSADQALVRGGADAAIVRARLEHDEREVLLEVQINRVGANRAQVNRSRSSPARCRGTSRACCSRRRISRSCAASRPGRRRFLDELLVQRSPGSPACSPTTSGCSASATAC